MFIVENASIGATIDFPEITEWSDDSYNILEGSMFFEEDLSKVIRSTALAEVYAFKEGTIESFNESAFETIKDKLKALWQKFKAFVLKVFDRFFIWISKVFNSNSLFLIKNKTDILKNLDKAITKNSDFKSCNINELTSITTRYRDEFEKKVSTMPKTKEDAESLLDKVTDGTTKYKDEFNEALNNEESFKFSELLDMVGKDIFRDARNIEKDIKKEKDSYKNKLAEVEKDLKTNKDSDKLAICSLKLKAHKLYLTTHLNFIITLNKKKLQIMTKLGYEALKLKHTKVEDINHESSIDILSKYLGRI